MIFAEKKKECFAGLVIVMVLKSILSSFVGRVLLRSDEGSAMVGSWYGVYMPY